MLGRNRLFVYGPVAAGWFAVMIACHPNDHSPQGVSGNNAPVIVSTPSPQHGTSPTMDPNKPAASSASLSGGTGDSGGADQIPEEAGSVWYVGSKPVDVCISSLSSFPVSTEIVTAQVKQAVSQWRDYFIKSVTQGDRILSGFENRDYQPDFNWSIHETCTEKEDLRIYLGDTSDEVERARSRYHNPTGFVHRTQYNQEKGWSRGFMWVNAEGPRRVRWENQTEDGNSYLAALFLHEFGHIFGSSHVPGTIMTEKLVDLLDNSVTNRIGTSYLTTIDNDQELVVNPFAPYQFKGVASELLFGDKPGVGIPAILTKKSENEDDLVISRNNQTVKLVIKYKRTKNSISGGLHVFKLWIHSKDYTNNMSVGAGGSMLRYGTLISSDKKEIQITLERNMGAPNIILRDTSNPDSPLFQTFVLTGTL